MLSKTPFKLIPSILALLLILVGCGESDSARTTEGQAGQTANDNAPTASEGDTRVFKIAHTASESHLWSKTIEKFNEELMARSDGRLSLDMYPNSILGNDEDMMQQMQAGSLDMAIIAAAAITNRYSTFNAWFMPFLFEDLEQAYEMSQTDEALAILDSIDVDRDGMLPLGYAHVGMRHVLLEDKPINSPADVNNLKLRVSSSPVIVDFWERMGAGPTSIPLSEVYTAFQTGVVDGMDIDTFALVSQKFYEIGKHLTLTNHMIYQGVALFSKVVWDELSDEDKQIIQEAFKVAQEFNFETSVNDEESFIQEFVDAGGTVHEITDYSPFHQVSADFIDEYRQSDPLIDAFVGKALEIVGQ